MTKQVLQYLKRSNTISILKKRNMTSHQKRYINLLKLLSMLIKATQKTLMIESL